MKTKISRDELCCCIFCKATMFLIDYGQIFVCDNCHTSLLRYLKPIVLAKAIDNLWIGGVCKIMSLRHNK